MASAISLAKIISARCATWARPKLKGGARSGSPEDAYYRDYAAILEHPRISSECTAADKAFAKPFVAIIGDLFLPQCKKYRVIQKLEILKQAGVAADYSHRLDIPRSLHLIQLATFVIFHRTEDGPELDCLMAETQRLGIPTAYDIDDPMFDETIYSANSNASYLDPAIRKHLLSRCEYHARAMAVCDFGIASTPVLAAAMRRYMAGPVVVWRNAIDRSTRHAADRALEARAARQGNHVVIAYSSGSLAHQADFMTAATALAALLERYPSLRLLAMGYAPIPDILQPFKDRIMQRPFRDYLQYMQSLATADISIVPLVANDFNACKSAIRFMEAALLGIPTVATATGDYVPLMAAGGGYLVTDDSQWFGLLQRLIASADLRQSVGAKARRLMLTRHTTQEVGRNLPFLITTRFNLATTTQPRLLIVNVFFAPTSYGGATVQAENMARIMAERFNWKVLVLTTIDNPSIVPYTTLRYTISSIEVVAIGIRGRDLTYMEQYENAAFEEVFDRVVGQFVPSVAHVHCIQTMGLGVLRSLRQRQVPVALTIHDAWWLCERQFMLDDKDQYCFQTRIDLDVCRFCVIDTARSAARLTSLRTTLDKVELLLFPSRFHLDLHRANDLASRGVVQKNGVRPPSAHYRRRRPDRGISLRFGFVGGPGSNKGGAQILGAFRRIVRTDYELVIVDGAGNMGGSWFDNHDWSVPGRLRAHAAYNQDTMDDFFSSIDVLLFPSQWKESFGLTVREALIRNIWVVVSDAGSVAEDCVDGINATIIPMTSDPTALQAAIEDLLARHEPASYRNVHRDKITTTAQQGNELDAALRGLLTYSPLDATAVGQVRQGTTGGPTYPRTEP